MRVGLGETVSVRSSIRIDQIFGSEQTKPEAVEGRQIKGGWRKKTNTETY